MKVKLTQKKCTTKSIHCQSVSVVMTMVRAMNQKQPHRRLHRMLHAMVTYWYRTRECPSNSVLFHLPGPSQRIICGVGPLDAVIQLFAQVQFTPFHYTSFINSKQQVVRVTVSECVSECAPSETVSLPPKNDNSNTITKSNSHFHFQ
jgi:hypothetical protein